MFGQHTLSRKISVSGIGLHSGIGVNMTLHPAGTDQGIRFRRTDMIGPSEDILASVNCVGSCERATTLSNEAGHSVSTVEHLLAASRGLGIDNMLVEIDAPEVPIMDGSSLDFCNLIKMHGLVSQPKPRNLIRILKRVEVRSGARVASLTPTDAAVLSLSAQIEFEDAAIGVQQGAFVLSPGVFCEELSFARTFGRCSELEGLHARGLALGGSLENAILVDGDRIVNEGGLRRADEFVRHKLLDAIGDLALAGGMIAGHYDSVQAGHQLNIELVKELMATPEAWCWEVEGVERALFQPERAATERGLALGA